MILTSEQQATIIGLEDRSVRQFIYGVLLGAVAMFAYERLDPPAILAYLNSATASAVKSTAGYGGAEKKR